MAPRDVMDEFHRIVQNDVPLRLIFVPEMKIVGRYDMQEYFRPQVEAITEDGVEELIWEGANRESVVTRLLSEIVKYAILSHRWLPNDEPTFRDMIDGTAAGLGREKLWNFCDMARTHEIMFAWSDTCCIDKSSSAEIDEAIRSMFRWYRNSSICFVHLAQTTSLEDLQADEWFERGWTLQELLAPRVTKFFDKDWHPLVDGPNHKGNPEILQHVIAATRCPEHALRDFNPGPFCVGRRMTWAARRKTTRGEDMAYSLMGIFDVTLQTAYGEGAERAFVRLVEKIMLSNGNQSVLDWAGKPAASHSSKAFPSSPRSYLGQTEYNLHRKLDMSMTSIGLRIPLLLLPLNKPRFLGRTKDDHHRVKVSLSDERVSSLVNPVTVVILKGLFVKDQDWALGVYNYMPPYGIRYNGHPGIRAQSVAYLLCRKSAPDIGGTQVEHGMKAKDDFRFYGWRKISTTNFITFTVKSIKEDEVMVVDKDFLEVVHL
ncbi:hypothetical protein CEP54_014288 [Fusarium duplospermum]|uniref:Heterokaryon incompatibility domain-containing protein n=1 Tax=Fusarium duplospermum TaxID=1325734 RepID=A0A428NX01_9HYPO|nr:hypothetical protein CEP54_014288 [Fusarium duplospermum]